MPVEALIVHGAASYLELPGKRFTRRYDGLDQGVINIQTDSLTSFAPGVAVPGYGGLMVMEDDVEEEVPAACYVHRLSAIGVVGAKPERKIQTRGPSNRLEGFDDGDETWLTTNKNKIVRGSSMPGYGNMICIDVVPETTDHPLWYRVTGRYLGLSTASKPVKREISSNVEIINQDSMIVTLAGGWSEAHKSQICWPKLTVTFTYWTPYLPVKYLPEQGGTPPGELFPVLLIEGSGVDLTYHWPNGWRMISFNPRPIPGTTISETTEVWEWQQQRTY